MFIATNNAIYAVEDNGNSEPTQIYNGADHQGHEAMVSLSNGQAVVSALSDGTLLVLSGDNEKRIPTGIEDPIASLLVVREDPLTLLIGTDEGAYVYRLVGEEGPAERVVAFDELACRKDWSTPWGGPPAVRTLAKTQDGFCYADIHVGSIMRSPDEGVSWEPVTPELHKDVHQVTTCPADDNRVYANTQNGVYVSADRGHSWENRIEGLPRRYGTGIAVHPTDPDLMIATVQNGPRGGGAWLCRSDRRRRDVDRTQRSPRSIHRSDSDRLYSLYTGWNGVGGYRKNALYRKGSSHRLEPVLDTLRIRRRISHPNPCSLNAARYDFLARKLRSKN